MFSHRQRNAYQHRIVSMAIGEANLSHLQHDLHVIVMIRDNIETAGITRKNDDDDEERERSSCIKQPNDIAYHYQAQVYVRNSRLL